MRGPSVTKALCALALLLSAATFPGCTVWRANARVQYWKDETTAHIPPGTRLEDAQAFFASRGLNLRCCTSGPDIDHAYDAMERHIGRFAWMEYDAEIVVDVADQRVTRVRVFRIGVGL